MMSSGTRDHIEGSNDTVVAMLMATDDGALNRMYNESFANEERERRQRGQGRARMMEQK